MLCGACSNNICLVIPKKVIEIKKDAIIVENSAGVRQEMKSIIDLEIGDFCLTQQNVAVQKLDKKQAEEILKYIK
jgi:hydrogenase maturation factor